MEFQAVKAFVSFVRAYSKHEASYIFRIKDLDLVGVAKSFGLLRLPKMPELKGRTRDNWDDADVDVSTSALVWLNDCSCSWTQWDNYAYSDKAQEAKRIAAGAAAGETEREKRRADRADIRQSNSAWSRQVARKEEKEVRREKKQRKKRWLKIHATAESAEINQSSKRPRSPVSGSARSQEDNDWEQLAAEERMAKKVRKGDVSQKLFDAEFGNL